MTSPAIQLAIKAGMTCYGGANLPPGHHSWQAYTPHIEKLVILAQAQALRDAAEKWQGLYAENVKDVLRRMAEELEK